MITDHLKDYTPEQLKSAYMAETILRNEPMPCHQVSFRFGEPDAKVDTIQKTYRWGTHSHTYNISHLIFQIPENWYERVYLRGIGSVTYNSKTSLVLDAVDTDVKLREDLDLPGFEVHKVILPTWEHKKTGVSRWGRPIFETYCIPAERYMVSCAIGDNDSAIAYAAVHANAAAANLKKNMMKRMHSMMGV